MIVSNCVVNLSGDKPKVLAEAARVSGPAADWPVYGVIASPDMDDATRARTWSPSPAASPGR